MNLINKIHENTIKKTSDVKLHKKKQAKKRIMGPRYVKSYKYVIIIVQFKKKDIIYYMLL